MVMRFSPQINTDEVFGTHRVLGVLTCAFLAGPWTGRDPVQYKIAGVLIGIGVVLWGVTVLAQSRHRCEAGRAHDGGNRRLRPGQLVCRRLFARAEGGATQQDLALAGVACERGGTLELASRFLQAAELLEQIAAHARQQVVVAWSKARGGEASSRFGEFSRAGACLDGIAPRRFLEAPRPANSKSTGRDLPPASANDAGASHALIRTLIAALEPGARSGSVRSCATTTIRWPSTIRVSVMAYRQNSLENLSIGQPPTPAHDV